MEVVLLGTAQIDPFIEFLIQHASESGADRATIYNPYPRSAGPDPERFRRRRLEGWGRSPDQPGWIRSWAAREDGRFVGFAELVGSAISTELHRAMLGMGVDRGFRRRGLGRRLAEACIAWAREQGLTWIDLGVFARNAPARALYQSLGFVEVGRREDRFRVDGESICDIQMALRLV